MSDADGPDLPQRRDRRYTVAAVVLLVLGLLLLGRSALTLLTDQEVDFVDGQAAAVADDGERWWVAAAGTAELGGVSCAATISGEGVSLQRVEPGRTVTVDGQEWRALVVVTAERAGDLVVRCTTVAPAELALVRDPDSATGGRAVLVPAILGLALLGAAAGGTWWLIARRSEAPDAPAATDGSAEDDGGVEADALREPEEPAES